VEKEEQQRTRVFPQFELLSAARLAEISFLAPVSYHKENPTFVTAEGAENAEG
jgi:hypothetical protein